MVSDESLIAGLAGGDPGASNQFVRRFQARVFGLAVTILGDRSAAEEVAQEAMLRAWRHAGAYDPRRARVDTWLLAITRNLAIDHMRMQRSRPPGPADASAQESLLARPGGGPEDETEIAAVRDSVAELPLPQRRALLLASLGGFTAAEIAEIEGVPLGTAKTRIRTALLKVRSHEEGATDER
jgi:RNA polymerase sigma-70 factor (ECF subfamily)